MAGDDAASAHHAVTQQLPIDQVRAVALATDGVLACHKGGWRELALCVQP